MSCAGGLKNYFPPTSYDEKLRGWLKFVYVRLWAMHSAKRIQRIKSKLSIGCPGPSRSLDYSKSFDLKFISLVFSHFSTDLYNVDELLCFVFRIDLKPTITLTKQGLAASNPVSIVRFFIAHHYMGVFFSTFFSGEGAIPFVEGCGAFWYLRRTQLYFR